MDVNGRETYTSRLDNQIKAHERIETVASQHSGREVRLVAGMYQTAPLSKLDEFWGTMKRLATGRADS